MLLGHINILILYFRMSLGNALRVKIVTWDKQNYELFDNESN